MFMRFSPSFHVSSVGLNSQVSTLMARCLQGYALATAARSSLPFVDVNAPGGRCSVGSEGEQMAR